MRAKVVRQMPRLSHHFHLSPSDIWDMSNDEMNAYLEAAEQIEQAQAEAQQRLEAMG